MNINGKVALVTGSAKRIGRATTIELARRGARVAIHHRSAASEPDAQETLRLVKEAGSDGAIFQAELTDLAQLDEMFADLRDHFGSLHILVNNASVFSPARAEDTTEAHWDEQMDSNAKAPFFAAQHAARLMTEGKIINIADVGGEVIWPGYLAYSVSKAALIAVNRGLAKAYAPRIQVNAVAPGPVLFPENYSEEQKASAIERTLMKRAGSADDVVRAIIFLIENEYITGEIIHVDGGRHII